MDVSFCTNQTVYNVEQGFQPAMELLDSHSPDGKEAPQERPAR